MREGSRGAEGRREEKEKIFSSAALCASAFSAFIFLAFLYWISLSFTGARFLSDSTTAARMRCTL